MNHQKASYRTEKKQKHSLLPRYHQSSISTKSVGDNQSNKTKPKTPSSPTTPHHQPSLPHLMRAASQNKSISQPLFHQIEHDINAYIQRFLILASKKFWYSNEYSATRDMISCTPLSTAELFDIHKKAYSQSILNDDVRITSSSHIYMIDARIGATFDKIYNGIYGIYQQFVDKNNHISYIYNDKIITDKLSKINLLNIISKNLNWNEYSNKLIKETNKQLLGPYKSYSLDKFTKLLQREYRTLSIMVVLINRNNKALINNNNQQIYNKNENNMNNNRNKKGHLISLLQQQINHDDDDDDDHNDHNDNDSKLSETANNEKDLNDLNETVKELKNNLNNDKKQLIETNNKILNIIKNAKENKDSEKSKNIKLEIENYVKTANDILTSRNKSYSLINKNDEEIDNLLSENKKLMIYGKQLLHYKYECIAYNENIIKLKKEFHGKNKRFKKEIKDKIAMIKDIDLNNLNEKESNYISMSAKIRSIIRFSAHNIKAGTMQILKALLNRVKKMMPPLYDEENEENEESLDVNELYECNIIHESIVLELEKQVDLCHKLICKLQDYSLKKQRKLHNKMKQIGMMTKGGDDNDEFDELEEHEYHSDDIIFRNNQTGDYEKKFLMVIWKNKIYRVYESELSFQNGKKAIIENNFRATDYGYNGHLTIDVRRSNKTKKTSVFKGYQFILNKHAFVVKDMLDIKYWRNYIQRGENLRKASKDWMATNNDDENTNNYNNRDRKIRFIRKTRSSSLI